jgi:hypothetical protein
MPQLTQVPFDISPAASGWLTPVASNRAALLSGWTAASYKPKPDVESFTWETFPFPQPHTLSWKGTQTVSLCGESVLT